MVIYALTALHLRYIWSKRLFFIFHPLSFLKNAFCYFTTIRFHPLRISFKLCVILLANAVKRNFTAFFLNSVLKVELELKVF